MKTKIILVFMLVLFAIAAKVSAQTTVVAQNIDRITLTDTVTVQIRLSNPLYSPQVVLIRLDSANTGTVKFQVKPYNSTDGVRSRMKSEGPGSEFYVTLKSGTTSGSYNLYVKGSGGTNYINISN